MKNHLVAILSVLSIAAGIYGYIELNSQTKDKSRFDPEIKSDEGYLNDISKEKDFAGALSRLALKGNRDSRSHILDNFSKYSNFIKRSSLQSLGYFDDPEVNNFLLSQINSYRIATLKGLGLKESEKRRVILKELNILDFTEEELVYYHLAVFKTSSLFSQKKKNLNFLIAKAYELNRGETFEDIIFSLSVHVPNFEKFHKLLEDKLFTTKNEKVIARAVRHLSVYRSGWLKTQSKRVFETNNLILLKSYLDRAPSFCPLNIWILFNEHYNSNEEVILKSAFSLNTKKAVELIKEKESKVSGLYKKYQDKFSNNVSVCL